MTHFLSIGTIASDIVRKETRNGVLATFRLRSGPKGRGQIWIDVEAWGHLAGTIHQHGRLDRAVIVAGRLTHKTWHDRGTGEARHRYVITAADIDLLPDGDEVEMTNTVVAAGTVDSEPTMRAAGTGTVTEFRLVAGRAGSKTGRLWIELEHWHRDVCLLKRGDGVVVSGRLAYGGAGRDRSRYYLEVARSCLRRRDRSRRQPTDVAPASSPR